jgi:uncharacterized membrane protein
MAASRKIPSAIRTDRDGSVRLIAEPRRFDRLVAEAFEPIARHARGEPAVLARLFEGSERIARVARRAEDRRALQRVVDVAWNAAATEVEDSRYRAELGRRREQALVAIAPSLHEAMPRPMT